MRKPVLSFLFIVFSISVAAQDRRPSHCIALAEANPGIEYLQLAAFGDALDRFSVRLHYIDHATFLIETAGGLSAATDYTGFLGITNLVPEVATMNHAHSSHWTSLPDPRIPNVLPGWGNGPEGISHNLDLGEMLVRNVPTDIRSRFGGGIEKNGNSIFIFEVAGLCIGHLGHLHHEPSEAQYAAIGRLDVVMAPVDGGLTLDRVTLIRMLKRMRASIVIPMHWFGGVNLDGFLIEMSEEFAIDRNVGPSIEVSLRTLPDRPTVMVLAPSFLRDELE